MKILFLTPQLPYPPHQGNTIRTFNLMVNLVPRHQIHLLSFVGTPQELGQAGPLRKLCRSIETVTIPPRSSLKRALSVFLSSQPDMAGRLSSGEFASALREWVRREKFDVVQVEGIEMAHYVGGLFEKEATARPLLVYDAHNAEYVLQRRAFETDRSDPRRWMGALYSLIQWRKLQRYEGRTLRSFDRVVAVSSADRCTLERLVPGLEIEVVPNGVDTCLFQPMASREGEELVFTGKMDFRPNVDAVLWFCQKVLPLLRERLPQLRFYIVGQSPHRRVLSLRRDPRVIVTGRVEDDRPFMAQARLYVAPLRVGGGTRLKILRAMAMGKAIVATSLACEGIELSGGEVVLADTPEAFAEAILELWEDPVRRRKLGERGRALVETRYDWRSLVPSLEEVYAR